MKLHWPTPLSLRHGSLRLRLLLSTLIWIAMAIAVAGWGLRDRLKNTLPSSCRTSWCISSTSSVPPSI